MTKITTNGTTTVTSKVLGAEGLEKTINTMTDFVHDFNTIDETNPIIKHLYRNALKGTENVFSGLREEKDFDEFNINDLLEFKQFVRVVGLDNYSYYTIAEYAYMYTRVLEGIEG